MVRAERVTAETQKTTIHNDPRGRTDEAAVSIADTPHLTGDPEWDAIELAETNPTKEPLKVAHG